MGKKFENLKPRRGLVWLCALLLAGCGGSELPLVDVSGKVTFAGGPCPKPGSISFVPERPEGDSSLKRAGTARFNEDGVFDATSYEPGDGLLPGKYTAIIDCWERPPEQPQDYQTLNHVPESYRPEFEVPADQSSFEVNFDVPKKT
jgi:hypothetical protein